MNDTRHHVRSLCRICGSNDLFKFLDLGSHPLSDAFVSKDQLKNEAEPYFPLSVHVCNECNLIQLMDVVDPRLLFSEEYALFSSASPALVAHFKKYADEMKEMFGHGGKKTVVEIASNDGALLAPLKDLGFSVLGVEPATNVAMACRSKGIEVFSEFFSKKSSFALKEKYGCADIVIANNVLAHVDDPLDFMQGVKNILSDTGVFVFEFQYGLELIKNTEFDNIYHEHVSYLTVKPLRILMEKCGMKIFDIRPNAMQGGSLRCYAVHKENNAYQATGMMEKLSKIEAEEGLDNQQTYRDFAKRAIGIRTKLLEVIHDAKARKKKIACYGAPAKGNTLLNFCGIGPDSVDYCVERTAFKIGKYTPGMHIPIISEEDALKRGAPDFYLLLIWNYFDAIMAKEKSYSEKGGKFIVPIPSVRVL